MPINEAEIRTYVEGLETWRGPDKTIGFQGLPVFNSDQECVTVYDNSGGWSGPEIEIRWEKGSASGAIYINRATGTVTNPGEFPANFQLSDYKCPIWTVSAGKK